jgi:hypothetical protein
MKCGYTAPTVGAAFTTPTVWARFIAPVGRTQTWASYPHFIFKHHHLGAINLGAINLGAINLAPTVLLSYKRFIKINPLVDFM